MILFAAFAQEKVLLSATDDEGQQESASVSFVEMHAPLNAPTVSAIGIRGAVMNAVPEPTSILVLIDTSASQVGAIKNRSLDAFEGLIETARRTDQFMVGSIDVDCIAMSETFESPESPSFQQSRENFEKRVPLGSTDIVGGLRTALALFADSKGPRSIVYIGDGPGLFAVDTDEFRETLEMLRASQISFSAIGIGSQVNWPCLAAIANQTGGMLMVPDETVSAKDAGAQIGRAAVETITWVTNIDIQSDIPDVKLRSLPAMIPPLRSDRDAVILIEGIADATGVTQITLSTNSIDEEAAEVVVIVPEETASEENAYLSELARNAAATDGLFLPTLGRVGLERARQAIHSEAAALAALAIQAQASGETTQALQLAEASLRRDPDNVEARLLRSVAQKKETTEREETDPMTTKANDPSPDIDEVASMRKVRSEQFEQETAIRLRDARRIMATDPVKSRDDLKELLSEIGTSDDLSSETRNRLDRQIVAVIRESTVRIR